MRSTSSRVSSDRSGAGPNRGVGKFDPRLPSPYAQALAVFGPSEGIARSVCTGVAALFSSAASVETAMKLSRNAARVVELVLFRMEEAMDSVVEVVPLTAFAAQRIYVMTLERGTGSSRCPWRAAR